MMKLLSGLMNKSAKEKIEEWRKDLWEALPEIFTDEEDQFGMNDDGNIAIRKGSATLFVNFGIDEGENFGWVIIYSPLVYMPQENLLPFYRRLLEINYDDSIFGTLSVCEDVVYLARTLAVEGLDESALGFSVAKLAEEADGIDDYLADEFGARLVEVEGLFSAA